MTFLALDVGNTRLKWALYDAAHPGAQLLAQGAEFLENLDKYALYHITVLCFTDPGDGDKSLPIKAHTQEDGN